jgi:hypothetical protein
MVSRARSPAKTRGHRQGLAEGARPLRTFDTSKHGGKWVATRRGEVVAVGDSFADVDAEVRRRGIENDVILTRVPRTGAVLL